MKSMVPESWSVPQQIRDRFGESAGRQRAMSADGHLLLVLHEPPGPNDRHRSAKLVWRSPSGEWNWTSDGNTTQLLKKHIASFTARIEQLEDQLQTAASAADYFSLLQAAAPLHRTSRNLHATLQQAREMMPDDHEIIVARDAAGDLERGFELLHLDAKNGLDYTVAQRSELQSQRAYEMSTSAHRLNIIAALFFPITAISSVFGMNFSHGLESWSSPWLFWGILAIGFLSGILLTRIIAHKPMPQDTGAQLRPVKPPRKVPKQARQKLQKAAV